MSNLRERQRHQDRNHSVFSTKSWTWQALTSAVLHWPQWLILEPCGKGIDKGVNSMRWGTLGVFWRLAATSSYNPPSTKVITEFPCISQSVSSVAQSCPTLWDPMNYSTPGLPVHHQLSEFTQTHIHQVGDAIQSSHPLLSPSPPAPNPLQHQGLFQWV